ncbi:MAG: hypothetical protein UW46_C0003G0037 [Candidatus Yanofskybacteria bacterium GW2011_GWF1_44_227]|uniref:Uncharacterized protein n=1 Tax=Candidatus Yanofskybacteria bacterium GW2011_GWE2_40_11 TaxID=1619033 RepID=A0A0G0QM83_9BACT|nr:MAG: hypothetical protein UT69_C0008G0021 [Candidatus Yanofskybacteria bacterium GW2011_GWE1_40_10]KKR41228.1 MAG: hypothetical protein UT75_C0001G0132 [Candidatus Yanofskybacteria bacterium GW2011_GWE2_40_11]KKT15696.1 MAG: hypothetical protein UV97_C0003G0028 [Candidatus Yanofskybacteria bacterium GW2011_GWF2_43_596]KKT53416.1 MAG: hypothetical protein UW46_C0003G0037 [Candidatus Yanofskybacteria bacterium GW2011_GWF1_44_227]OGN36173.1 MAG: hypothetical protein A2241_00290 [Candidatus Yano
MIIGAADLLEKFGSPLAVAEALILGQLTSYEQDYVSELVGKIIMDAAKFRVEKSLAANNITLKPDKVLTKT